MNAELILPIALALAATALTIKVAFNWRGEKYLCQNCRFNNDNDCHKVERPEAEICMAYKKKI